jgi:hypothetical protein
VPQSWAVPPEIRQLAKALPMTNAGAAPVAFDDGGENPYTGMALASLLGSGMGGLAARGGSTATTSLPRPAAPKPAATKAPNPAAGYTAVTGAVPTENIAAQLAATLAAMPGATIVVIPPPPASG